MKKSCSNKQAVATARATLRSARRVLAARMITTMVVDGDTAVAMVARNAAARLLVISGEMERLDLASAAHVRTLRAMTGRVRRLSELADVAAAGSSMVAQVCGG